MTDQDRREAHLVDAFTTEPFGGNPAGVIPDGDGLSDEQMQAIANELGASETVFIQSSEEADRHLRFFTPEREVDLCGHATIGAHARLFQQAALDAGESSISTASGDLSIEIEPDGLVWMEAGDIDVESVDIEYERLTEVLDLTERAFSGVGKDLPVGRTAGGMRFVIVPVNYFEQLGDINPDLGEIENLCETHSADGLYVFSFDTLEQASTVHGRLFAPSVGVDEDPVTGTASGAVAAYLERFSGIDTSEIRCEQGDFLNRPGRVDVRIDESIYVGGRAVTTMSGEIAVPDISAEEIIEV